MFPILAVTAISPQSVENLLKHQTISYGGWLGAWRIALLERLYGEAQYAIREGSGCRQASKTKPGP